MSVIVFDCAEVIVVEFAPGAVKVNLYATPGVPTRLSESKATIPPLAVAVACASEPLLPVVIDAVTTVVLSLVARLPN